MKKFFEVIKFILFFIWQIPQNLIAIFMLCYFLLRGSLRFVQYDRCAFAFQSKYMRGGISLGSFVFLSELLSQYDTYIAHEFGHTWWSHLLGPFYLIIIGIPSICWAMSCDADDCYECFYTERWANKKAGLVIKGFGRYCYLEFKE